MKALSSEYIPHINGCIAEFHGYQAAIKQGHIGIRGPKHVNTPGPDFITYNPKDSRLYVWDSKYRKDCQWPSKAKGFRTKEWTKAVQEAIDEYPDELLRNRLQFAFDHNLIEWRIFQWP